MDRKINACWLEREGRKGPRPGFPRACREEDLSGAHLASSERATAGNGARLWDLDFSTVKSVRGNSEHRLYSGHLTRSIREFRNSQITYEVG